MFLVEWSAAFDNPATSQSLSGSQKDFEMSMETMKYHRARLAANAASEFYGLCLGTLADGILSMQEAKFLRDWLSARPGLSSDPIIAAVSRNLSLYLDSGVEGGPAENDLINSMLSLTGQPLPDDIQSAVPCSLPLCDPLPVVQIPGSSFCFTGTFDLGTRNECHQHIAARGGVAVSNVTKRLNYLVIGNNVTPDWKQQTYGGKIIKAMEYRDAHGVTIAIINEKHLVQFL